MKPEAVELRKKVEQLKEQLSTAETDLEKMVESCEHKFCKPIYDPVYTPAYTIPGDKPGTMGVDWRGPCHVDAKTEDRWKRVCETCGVEQYTTHVKENVAKVPDWSDYDNRGGR